MDSHCLPSAKKGCGHSKQKLSNKMAERAGKSEEEGEKHAYKMISLAANQFESKGLKHRE